MNNNPCLCSWDHSRTKSEGLLNKKWPSCSSYRLYNVDTRQKRLCCGCGSEAFIPFLWRPRDTRVLEHPIICIYGSGSNNPRRVINPQRKNPKSEILTMPFSGSLLLQLQMIVTRRSSDLDTISNILEDCKRSNDNPWTYTSHSILIFAIHRLHHD